MSIDPEPQVPLDFAQDRFSTPFAAQRSLGMTGDESVDFSGDAQEDADAGEGEEEG